MEVKIDITPAYENPLAEIHTKEITEEVKNAIAVLTAKDPIITAQYENKTVILSPEEICLVRIEGKDTIIYTKDQRCYSRLRLYEMKEKLGNTFMQISKFALVNLKVLDYVEASFNGTLQLSLKNGCKENVSRRYLPDFKKYLGL